MPSRPRVVVAGAGFAGLETAFLLRHRLHDEIDLTVVSDRDAFLFRPNTIYIPFGAAPDDFEIPLAAGAARQRIRLEHGVVEAADVARRRLLLTDRQVPYDYLVLATGAAMRPSEVPGLERHAASIWTPADMLRLRQVFRRIEARGREGLSTEVLFLVPPNNKCSGPLYELLFMLDTHLRRRQARAAVGLQWATYEEAYLQAFGPRLDEVVTTELNLRGITGHKGRQVQEVAASAVRFTDGGRLTYDELIAFPPYVAAVHYPDLPVDGRGFVRTVSATRAVEGVEGVYAPGDAGDFPVKQAFLAFLEAEAVAEDIAARVTGGRPKTTFDPVSLCIMEQLDKATFAQVPLAQTGDPARPVEVRADAAHDYRVGVSPLWRFGKRLLGAYLPMRFRAGEPFHAGAAWRMMDLGLKGASSVLAD